MRVLVTGCCGFIGNALTRRLVKMGYDVWGLDTFYAKWQYLHPKVKTYVADVTDKHSISKAIKAIQPEVVIHLAAITPVSLSFKMPKTYMEVNYGGTINLAEACLDHAENLRAFIYASTSEVYGNQREFPIVEEVEPRPNTPYSVSKYAAELYLKVYMREAYDFPVVVARPFNTYGRANVRQRHFVVEKILTSMLEGKEVIELGNPEARRDFLFREDHVEGYIAILRAVERGERIFGEVFNFCTNSDVSIRELVQIAAEIIGWKGEVRWGMHYRPTDIKRLRGSYEKAWRRLGWKPKYNLEEGLAKAASEWQGVLKQP